MFKIMKNCKYVESKSNHYSDKFYVNSAADSECGSDWRLTNVIQTSSKQGKVCYSEDAFQDRAGQSSQRGPKQLSKEPGKEAGFLLSGGQAWGQSSFTCAGRGLPGLNSRPATPTQALKEEAPGPPDQPAQTWGRGKRGLNSCQQDFRGGPVTKALHFHCGGYVFHF